MRLAMQVDPQIKSIEGTPFFLTHKNIGSSIRKDSSLIDIPPIVCYIVWLVAVLTW